MFVTLLLMTPVNFDHTQITLTAGSNRPLATELTTKCTAVANRLRPTIWVIDTKKGYKMFAELFTRKRKVLYILVYQQGWQ